MKSSKRQEGVINSARLQILNNEALYNMAVSACSKGERRTRQKFYVMGLDFGIARYALPIFVNDMIEVFADDIKK